MSKLTFQRALSGWIFAQRHPAEQQARPSKHQPAEQQQGQPEQQPEEPCAAATAAAAAAGGEQHQGRAAAQRDFAQVGQREASGSVLIPSYRLALAVLGAVFQFFGITES